MECLPDIIETRLLTPDTPYDCILTLLSAVFLLESDPGVLGITNKTK